MIDRRFYEIALFKSLDIRRGNQVDCGGGELASVYSMLGKIRANLFPS